jgi:hypothetical protein
MTQGKERSKMWFAIHAMTRYGKDGTASNKNRDRSYKISSRVFAALKENFSKVVSDAMKGRVFTPEHRDNLRRGLTGRKLSEECKLKLGEASANVPRTEEWCNRIGASRKAAHANNTVLHTCNVCGLQSKLKANITRWHNANCKVKL